MDRVVPVVVVAGGRSVPSPVCRLESRVGPRDPRVLTRDDDPDAGLPHRPDFRGACLGDPRLEGAHGRRDETSRTPASGDRPPRGRLPRSAARPRGRPARESLPGGPSPQRRSRKRRNGGEHRAAQAAREGEPATRVPSGVAPPRRSAPSLPSTGAPQPLKGRPARQGGGGPVPHPPARWRRGPRERPSRPRPRAERRAANRPSQPARRGRGRGRG